MGFSAGAGSLSRTSTISPEFIKSSSNSSIEKKVSPSNKQVESGNFLDGPNSIKKHLVQDLNESPERGHFTQREIPSSKKKLNNDYERPQYDHYEHASIIPFDSIKDTRPNYY